MIYLRIERASIIIFSTQASFSYLSFTTFNASFNGYVTVVTDITERGSCMKHIANEKWIAKDEHSEECIARLVCNSLITWATYYTFSEITLFFLNMVII